MFCIDVTERYPLVAQPFRNSRLIAAFPPAGPSGPHAGAVRKMLIKHDGLGGQPVQVRRRDPGVAVATQEAQVQAGYVEDNDFHEVIVGRSRWNPWSYR